MLPRVVPASQVKPFKFWFNDSLQTGVHFENELYYQLRETPATEHSRLYHLACRLTKHGADVFLTVSDEQCNLWANLRNQKVLASNMSEKLSLPTAEGLMKN
ncbi:MAG: hypothetical protein AAGD09_25965 [Cyanobacteria bacterium P01_F01_bin.56]